MIFSKLCNVLTVFFLASSCLFGMNKPSLLKMAQLAASKPRENWNLEKPGFIQSPALKVAQQFDRYSIETGSKITFVDGAKYELIRSSNSIVFLIPKKDLMALRWSNTKPGLIQSPVLQVTKCLDKYVIETGSEITLVDAKKHELVPSPKSKHTVYIIPKADFAGLQMQDGKIIGVKVKSPTNK